MHAAQTERRGEGNQTKQTNKARSMSRPKTPTRIGEKTKKSRFKMHEKKERRKRGIHE